MKAFYNTKLLRERVLMLVFVAIGVLWWGTALIGRIGRNVEGWHAVGVDKRTQQAWLAKGAAISGRTEQVASKLERSKAMNAAQAFAEVSRLAAGLPLEISGQRTEPTDNFYLHSLQVRFGRTDMASLIRFYEGLVARAPYLGIEQCTISAERASPGQINAVFRIYSVEPK